MGACPRTHDTDVRDVRFISVSCETHNGHRDRLLRRPCRTQVHLRGVTKLLSGRPLATTSRTSTQEPKHPEEAAYCHLGRELVTKESCKYFDWENSSDLSVRMGKSVCLPQYLPADHARGINAPAMYVATQAVLSLLASRRTLTIMMHDELRVSHRQALRSTRRCLCALRDARPALCCRGRNLFSKLYRKLWEFHRCGSLTEPLTYQSWLQSHPLKCDRIPKIRALQKKLWQARYANGEGGGGGERGVIELACLLRWMS